MTRRKTGPTPEVRAIVWHRGEGRCVLCGCSRGEQIHHRRPRGIGGTRLDWINQPANLVLLCQSCHQHIETNRTVFRERGFLIPMGNLTAEQVPLIFPTCLVWLRNDGTAHTFQKVSPA